MLHYASVLTARDLEEKGNISTSVTLLFVHDIRFLLQNIFIIIL
jgi:hypothetical protein